MNDKFNIVVAITKGDDRAEAIRLMYRGLSISSDSESKAKDAAHAFWQMTKLVGGGKFSSYGLAAVQNETTGEIVKTWPL